jgi:hypothetical protein
VYSKGVSYDAAFMAATAEGITNSMPAESMYIAPLGERLLSK